MTTKDELEVPAANGMITRDSRQTLQARDMDEKVHKEVPQVSTTEKRPDTPAHQRGTRGRLPTVVTIDLGAPPCGAMSIPEEADMSDGNSVFLYD
nr:hypothetical protein BaRGS_001823 [Batillaria attramentaria]